MDGHIVLALSSTLWIDRLVVRTALENTKNSVMVNLFDAGNEILKQKLGEVNKDHMAKLYYLCETGGIDLPDFSIGLAKEKWMNVTAAYAYLPLGVETNVEVSNIESPQRFYVTIFNNQRILDDLEKDIKAGVSLFIWFDTFNTLMM